MFRKATSHRQKEFFNFEKPLVIILKGVKIRLTEGPYSMENVTIPSSQPNPKFRKDTLICRILSSVALAGELAFLIWGIISCLSPSGSSEQSISVAGIVLISLVFAGVASYSLTLLIKGPKISRGTMFTWGILGGVGWLAYCVFLVIYLFLVLLAGVLILGFGAVLTGSNSSSSSVSSSETSMNPTIIAIANGLDGLIILGIIVTLLIILRLVFMGLGISGKKNPATMALWFFISTLLVLMGLLVALGMNLYLATLNGPTSIFAFSLPMLGGLMCQIGADYFAFKDGEDKTKPYPEEVELGPIDSNKTQD